MLLITLLFTLPLSYTLATPITTTPSPSSSPTATCSYIEKSPLPKSHHCGVQGRLLKHDNPFASQPGTSDAACLTHCLTSFTTFNTTCRAFAHDKTVQQCNLYNTSIDNAGSFKASLSNIWFWNLKCFTESCTAKGINHSTSTFSTTLAPSSSTGIANATTATKSISAPVTTVTHSGQKCTIPLPLSVRDCKHISMPISNSRYTAQYSLYFNGTGVTESPSNPGNPPNNYLPAYTTALKARDSGCDAATECVGVATAMGIGNVYMSFDLHYDLKSCRWLCTVYGGYNDNGTYFDVVDGDAFRTHGFSAKMKKAH